MQKPADSLAVDLVTLAAQIRCHPWPTVERRLGALLSDQLHEWQVVRRLTGWLVVPRGAIEIDQIILPPQA